jgi:OOP family OmpA-OmpF porin
MEPTKILSRGGVNLKRPRVPPLTVFLPRPDGSRVAVLSDRILFRFDSSQLTLQGRRTIRALVSEIKRHRGDVRVEGYADGVGTTGYNLALSRGRANSVLRFLVTLGIHPRSISSIGRGEEGAADNLPDPSKRRVEIVLAP